MKRSKKVSEQTKLFFQLQSDRTKVKNKAGTVKLAVNERVYALRRLRFMLERFERLVLMAYMALNSQAYKQRLPVYDVNEFYYYFGRTAVIDDWRFMGVLLGDYPMPPGRFVAKLELLEYRRNMFKYEITEMLSKEASSKFYNWLNRRSRSYDMYGRKLRYLKQDIVNSK